MHRAPKGLAHDTRDDRRPFRFIEGGVQAVEQVAPKNELLGQRDSDQAVGPQTDFRYRLFAERCEEGQLDACKNQRCFERFLRKTQRGDRAFSDQDDADGHQRKAHPDDGILRQPFAYRHRRDIAVCHDGTVGVEAGKAKVVNRR